MKRGVYFASLVTAVMLLVIVSIVLIPSSYFDRQHNVFVIGLSVFVLAVHFGILAAYPFVKTSFFASMVKNIGFVSMGSMLLLALSCPPNFEVKGIFTSIDSKAALESHPTNP